MAVNTRRRRRRIAAVTTLLLAGAALGACRQEEQGRFDLEHLNKGTYQGAPDTPLDNETLEDLRGRMSIQAG
ncbi:hypothetical protein [Futiania mangrovi]|uniref:Uncharacterized protein n=1 Tax=Futiania mangrovi TaxID=2959716 RepID=A0A9J6PCA5_9PROT|nr:hypothetical protein [Futiania mangrovii]MCP1335416.1 hypothetical protein [Futiania mangrovii]